MKRIHFDNLNKNLFLIAIIILSIICLIIGLLQLIPNNPELNRMIMAIGFLLQLIFYSRMFWYKNYMQWNKKGAVLKINSFFGKTLNFSEIQTTNLIDKKLIITKFNGQKTTFDLENIVEEDREKLNKIINRYI
ncbi:MAG: hypothetical protein KGV44_07890 [Flavobacteriaceae bacterium]|nr:hypothetical protein [Flavobacteriaceae bacterium]